MQSFSRLYENAIILIYFWFLSKMIMILSFLWS